MWQRFLQIFVKSFSKRAVSESLVKILFSFLYHLMVNKVVYKLSTDVVRSHIHDVLKPIHECATEHAVSSYKSVVKTNQWQNNVVYLKLNGGSGFVCQVNIHQFAGDTHAISRRRRLKAFTAAAKIKSTDSSTRHIFSHDGGAAVFRQRLRQGWLQKLPAVITPDFRPFGLLENTGQAWKKFFGGVTVSRRLRCHGN